LDSVLVLFGMFEAKDATRTHDATRLPRWKRVRVMSQIFWDETLFLLINAQNAEMQEAVLRTVATSPQRRDVSPSVVFLVYMGVDGVFSSAHKHC
jgi:hypothetical protein